MPYFSETALDAGQLADAHRHLMGIDEQLQGADAPVALQTRIATSKARLAQLENKARVPPLLHRPTHCLKTWDANCRNTTAPSYKQRIPQLNPMSHET